MSAGRARSSVAVGEFLGRLPRLALILGKGGVGKTTCALGVAARFAASGERTLLISTDPAQSLGPALETPLEGGEARSINVVSGLFAMQLDPTAARRAFLDRWRDVLVTIVDRGTYLDVDDIGGLVDASFPGADEIFGLLVLAELLRGDSTAGSAHWARVVVDTAPTGHTLRLLTLPDTFAAMISLLDAMQAKHRFMVKALTRRYRRDAADDFLDEQRRALNGLRSALGNPARSAAILVTRAEPVVVSETTRYAEAIRALGISITAVVVDAMTAHDGSEITAVAETLREIAGVGRLFGLPRIDPPPTGITDAAAALGALAPIALKQDTVRDESKGLTKKRRRIVALKAGGPARAHGRSGQPPALQQLLRTLTVIGGKGGVGKTTVSCALAFAAALDETGTGDILLVSTDPAPSIADALGILTPRWAYDEPEPLEAIPTLRVWQMDAARAFEQFRDRYQNSIDALFDSLMGRAADAVYDRAILRDLLALAPPGIDELYAVASLGEAIEQRRYVRIVVDPAPTGHLLRLLELPTLAIDWSHRLLRLMMKYKDIAGLTDAAQELINFSRHTRALDALLRDPTRAGAVLVALDEPMVVAETTRLKSALETTGVAVVGQIWNRVQAHSERVQTTLPRLDRSVPTFLAPEHLGPLVGVAAMRDWSLHWQQRN